MNKIFSDKAWEDWMFWSVNDKKIARKIHKLMSDIERNGAEKGIGSPEALKYDLAGLWSREITKKDRLVYRVDELGLHVYSCRGHYGDK